MLAIIRSSAFISPFRRSASASSASPFTGSASIRASSRCARSCSLPNCATSPAIWLSRVMTFSASGCCSGAPDALTPGAAKPVTAPCAPAGVTTDEAADADSGPAARAASLPRKARSHWQVSADSTDVGASAGTPCGASRTEPSASGDGVGSDCAPLPSNSAMNPPSSSSACASTNFSHG